MKNKSGFTLIELMVVIGIIAILLAISVPVMGKWKARHEFTGALQDVLLTLRQARTVAVEENETVMFSLNAAGGVWQAFVDDGGGNATDQKGVRPDGTIDGNPLQPDGVPDLAQNRSWDTGERIINSGTAPGSVSITTCKINGTASASISLSFNARGYPVDGGGNLLEATITMASDLGGSRDVKLYQSGHSAIQ